MAGEKWSFNILIRYIILQLAGLFVVIGILYLTCMYFDIPMWLNLTIVFIWLIKDAVLYPFVWRAYDWDHRKSGDSMIGTEGVATERIAPTGYIMVRGELWKAEAMEEGQTLEKGQKVLVNGVKGLTLYVKPVQML